jgi:polyisoprenyl-phosphate glycosyltransferase
MFVEARDAQPGARTDRACALSVVVPCFNESECLAVFHARAKAACEALVGDSYEIVLVDDGSSDATWAGIAALSASNPGVAGVKLMRNHGHQLASTAGLHMCVGSRVLLIDADLQDPPELVGDMWALMERGADVVYGKRVSREGESWFKRTTASLFYRMLRRSTDVAIPLDTGDFRMMSRRVVDLLNAMPERQRFLRGMVSWIGGNQVPLEYERQSRHAGRTKYPLRKMVLFAIDAFTSFSIMPLRVAFWIGLASAIFAGLILAYVMAGWLAGGVVPGWTSMMAVSVFFAGVQLAVLGVIGEYLGRLVQEAKRRPLFMIEKLVGRSLIERAPASGTGGAREALVGLVIPNGTDGP